MWGKGDLSDIPAFFLRAAPNCTHHQNIGPLMTDSSVMAVNDSTAGYDLWHAANTRLLCLPSMLKMHLLYQRLIVADTLKAPLVS